MNNKNDIDTRLDRMCAIYRTTGDEMHTLGKSLLTLIRDVYRSTKLDAIDLEGRLCSYSDDQDEERQRWEALVRLEFFATEFERRRYEEEISSILETGWLLKVAEALKAKVYNFPDYGPDFVTILSLTYLNTFKYTLEEMEQTTGFSKATIYRHKRRAVILFGLAFLEYKQDYMMPDPHSFGYSGEQLTLDFN